MAPRLPAACAAAPAAASAPQQQPATPPDGLRRSAFQQLASLPFPGDEPPAAGAGLGTPRELALRACATAPSSLIGLCAPNPTAGFSPAPTLEPSGSVPVESTRAALAQADDVDDALARLRARAATCLLPSCTQGAPHALCAGPWQGMGGFAAPFAGVVESLGGYGALRPPALQSPPAHT